MGEERGRGGQGGGLGIGWGEQRESGSWMKTIEEEAGSETGITTASGREGAGTLDGMMAFHEGTGEDERSPGGLSLESANWG